MSDTQLIKDKIDIVDLVGEYVQLKPAGVNQKGLCPFHREKTPSFMVSRERQSWHCFGCSKGGDIFSFIQEIESMEFIEALRFLADRAGVPLTHTRSESDRNQKNRLKDINVEAARFFHQFLLQMPAAAGARQYLNERGLKEATIEEWRIGFISDQWDLLTQYLLKKGYGIDDLVVSGLTIKKDGGGFYDRFRGRIMFPIWDAHDTVVGFTGRVLVETETSGGKYVNTPQTPLYDKSRVVFGLNKAKQEIKKNDRMIMVEGQMDVVACHQAGMKHVVAVSGTAMTEQQVEVLKRYSSNVSISFDADSAGIAAAKRGRDVALQEGMNITIIRIPDGAGKDPDECLKKNPEVWFDAVLNAEEYIEWLFVGVFRGRNITNPKEKQQIANELLPDISRIPYAVERDHWLRELAGRIGVDVDILKEDMERIRRSPKSKPQQAKPNEVVSPYPPQKTRMDALVERFLVLVLRYPTAYEEWDLPGGVTPMLSTPDLAHLYESVGSGYTTQHSISRDNLRHAFSDGNIENIVDTLILQGDLLFQNTHESQAKKEVAVIVAEIKKEWKQAERIILEREIDLAERAGDATRIAHLNSVFETLR